MLAMMGLALASVVLTIAHGSWLVGEAVAGALYLFCGAVFPLDVLPAWLRPVGYLMPVTYWLELVRRALVGRVAHQYPSLAGIGDGELLVLVVAMTGCARRHGGGDVPPLRPHRARARADRSDDELLKGRCDEGVRSNG